MFLIIRTYSIIFLLSVVLMGCAANMTAKKRTEVRLPANSRIAVLPFENLSGTEYAAEKITDYFQTMMSAQMRFETVDFGKVYDGLRDYRIRTASQLTDSQIDSLTSRLQVNYLLLGSVLEYEEHDNNYLGRLPQVSFNCRLLDCKTHKILWVATSNGRGDKGEFVFGIGAIRSADNLSRKMVQDAVNDITGIFNKK